MKTNKKQLNIILGGAAILVFFIIAITVISNGGTTPPTNNLEDTSSTTDKRAVLKRQIPDLTLKDYDGNDVRLQDIEGDVVLLNSWATWCPFCVNEIPDFVQAQNALEGQATVVLINRQESLSRAKKFTDDLGATGNVITLLDPSDSFYKKIGGFAMPETLIVKDNNIVLHKRGPMKFEEVVEKLRSALEST